MTEILFNYRYLILILIIIVAAITFYQIKKMYNEQSKRRLESKEEDERENVGIREQVRKTHLKPCPFCEGKAQLFWRNSIAEPGKYYWIECDQCPAKIALFRNLQDAIQAWEKRINLITEDDAHKIAHSLYDALNRQFEFGKDITDISGNFKQTIIANIGKVVPINYGFKKDEISSD